VALDEADKMLSLGFAPQLQRLRALLLEQPRGGGSGSRRRRPQVCDLDVLFDAPRCSSRRARLQNSKHSESRHWVHECNPGTAAAAMPCLRNG
jgi:hypothetical protein